MFIVEIHSDQILIRPYGKWTYCSKKKEGEGKRKGFQTTDIYKRWWQAMWLVINTFKYHVFAPISDLELLFLPLVALNWNCYVAPPLLCVHIHSLSSDWQRPLGMSKNLYLFFMCCLICVFYPETSFLGKCYPLMFLFLCSLYFCTFSQKLKKLTYW